MNDKIVKYIAIVIVCLLLIVAAYGAIVYSRELGDLRRGPLKADTLKAKRLILRQVRTVKRFGGMHHSRFGLEWGR